MLSLDYCDISTKYVLADLLHGRCALTSPSYINRFNSKRYRYCFGGKEWLGQNLQVKFHRMFQELNFEPDLYVWNIYI